MRACGILAVVLAAVWVGHAPAGEPRRLTADELAARIDHHVDARLREAGVPAAPAADDAAFLRRAYLDLAGRIPNILEIRDFLDDDRPDKRRLLVEDLLRGLRAGPDRDTYSDHAARVWRGWLLASSTAGMNPELARQFEAWLRQQFRRNTPHDEVVRSLLAGGGDGASDPGPALFHAAYENRPENVAAAASRLFLGTMLDCAQCHDDRSGGGWSREQFWQFAAFFTPDRSIVPPDAKKAVAARFLDGGAPPLGRPGPRAAAEWVTRAGDRAFARATVNRVWSFYFAVGLTDPVDAAGDHNPPSHPALLDELADQFVKNNHDLKYLVRAIMASRAYQRTSRQTHAGQADPRLFAVAPVRELTAAQLYASLAIVTELKDDDYAVLDRSGADRPGDPRDQLAARFADPGPGAEPQTTILQALYLMNGPFVARATRPAENRTLATIADATRIDTGRRVETLYLVALSRKPTAAEAKKVAAYVDRGGPTGNPRRALADVLWALLNSAEFRYNH